MIGFVGLNSGGGDNTSLLDAVTLERLPVPLDNAGFEAPEAEQADPFYSFVAYPGASASAWAWSFSGNYGGVAANGSAYASTNPDAPDGDQAAFLHGPTAMSQAVTWSAGTYRLSFAAARCGGATWSQHAPVLKVWIDGTLVGTFSPAGTAYESFTTDAFDVAAGPHTVVIRSLGPDSDYAALVDDVRIARVGAAPVTTWTVYDGVNPYADFDGAGDLQTRYLHGPAVDLLLARSNAAGATAGCLNLAADGTSINGN